MSEAQVSIVLPRHRRVDLWLEKLRSRSPRFSDGTVQVALGAVFGEDVVSRTQT